MAFTRDFFRIPEIVTQEFSSCLESRALALLYLGNQGQNQSSLANKTLRRLARHRAIVRQSQLLVDWNRGLGHRAVS
jgi:hypothetical protein